MSTIFLAFANNRDNPLNTLKEEDDSTYRWLLRRSAKNHFSLHRDSYCSLDKIAEYLILLRDSIEVFLYSGHAGKDRLLLEGGDAQSSGIAELLGQCPNLKMVVLNGCSTVPQVNELLENGVPIVIATHAPVEDKSATRFSTHFFQALCEHHASIEEAFDVGIAAAKLVDSNFEITRGIGVQKAELKSLWGLFHKEEYSSVLNWKLPTEPIPTFSDYSTNEILMDSLLETLAGYNTTIAKITEDEELGIERSMVDKRKEILESMPYPISEHLRKLMVPQDTGSEHVFYDQLGAARLNQIVITYKTIIELMETIMLAQLWDSLLENKDLTLDEKEKEILSNHLGYGKESSKNYDFPPLIRMIRVFFIRNEIPVFMEELKDVAKIFDEQSHFFNACIFMEMHHKKKVNDSTPEQELHQLCMVAEEKLAAIFKPLGFIVNYVLTSVKDIEVIKYRHLDKPRFKHQVVKLVQRFVGLAEEPQVMTDYTDSASVLLLKQPGADSSHFLNLSPFMIDENAFDEKAVGISKLYLFSTYESIIEAFSFKHIYKPKDKKLIIKKQKHYKVLRAQLDAFAKLVFGNPF